MNISFVLNSEYIMHHMDLVLLSLQNKIRKYLVAKSIKEKSDEKI